MSAAQRLFAQPATATRAEFSGPLAELWQTVTATTSSSFKRSTAYLVNVIRAPLGPLVMFIVMYLSWDIAGYQTVNGINLPGFLLVGLVGSLTWSASVWSGGSALDSERWEGTIAALFLSPANRVAVIMGHGIGGLVYLLPSAVVVIIIGLITGASFNLTDPLAAFAGFVALICASLATGLLLAALFILSRRANVMANAIQHPVNLLGGFVLPRDELPGWLHAISDLLPVSHALDAFRAATLSGASLNDVAPQLAAACVACAACTLLGILGLRRIEHVAKRGGQLDLY
jgi:ABC-2 type transport system permease protein